MIDPTWAPRTRESWPASQRVARTRAPDDRLRDTRDRVTLPGYRLLLRSSSFGGQVAHPGYACLSYPFAGAAGGDSATEASLVSMRKVKVSCR